MRVRACRHGGTMQRLWIAEQKTVDGIPFFLDEFISNQTFSGFRLWKKLRLNVYRQQRGCERGKGLFLRGKIPAAAAAAAAAHSLCTDRKQNLTSKVLPFPLRSPCRSCLHCCGFTPSASWVKIKQRVVLTCKLSHISAATQRRKKDSTKRPRSCLACVPACAGEFLSSYS